MFRFFFGPDAVFPTHNDHSYPFNVNMLMTMLNALGVRFGITLLIFFSTIVFSVIKPPSLSPVMYLRQFFQTVVTNGYII